MATFLIALFSVILVLVCLFVTLLVLMQKPSANSGMGAALGGGAAEQAFGGEAGNVLTRGTIYAIIAFFILSFALYLGTLASVENTGAEEGASITRLEGEAPMEAAPAAEDEPAAPSPAGELAPGQPAAAAEDPAETDSSAPLRLEELDLDATKPAEGS